MPGVQQAMQLLCIGCNEVLDEDAHTEGVCEDCINDHTWTCESCYEIHVSSSSPSSIRSAGIFERDEPIEVLDTLQLLCSSCVISCHNCGEYYYYEDSMNECCGHDTHGIVHSWDYRPRMRFWRHMHGQPMSTHRAAENVLYMGMELEVEKMADIADVFLRDANEIYDDPKFLYLKSDGSLSSLGVEIVTMPATLDAFKERWPADAMEKMRNLGARSFYYESCGFHIHVSRTAFTAPHMWKFVRFHLRNADFCQAIAQRGDNTYSNWYEIRQQLNDLPKVIKGETSNRSRYMALNFQRPDTVELRYFKGNINNSAIYKNLEFVDSLYEYTKQLSFRSCVADGLTASAYLAWLYDNTERYQNLFEFLERENLMTKEDD